MGSHTFYRVRDDLAQKLSSKIRTGHSSSGTLQEFAPRLTAHNLLLNHIGSVQELCRCSRDRDRQESLQNLQSPEDIAELLVGSHEGDISTNFSTVVAILIISRVDIATWQNFEDAVFGKDYDRFFDVELPFQEDFTVKYFGSVGSEFYTNQFTWCPIVLRKHEQVRYDGIRHRCPLPYLSKRERGQGAFGTVYEVELERGHLISEADENRTQKYAQKVFFVSKSRRKDFNGEWKAVQDILRSRSKHDNIMVSLASLVTEDSMHTTFSIFFPLAHCNLWDFLTESQYEHGICNQFEVLENSDLERNRVVHQTILLCEALDHLHRGLTEGEHQLACWHLDLKPQNILVSLTSEGVLFQLSDFGISHVQRIDRSQAQLDLRDVFEKGTDQEQKSLQAGGNSDCISPEVFHGGAPATAASDVWSYGCILSLVLTFLEHNHSGIKTFASLRQRSSGEGDWFFQFPLAENDDLPDLDAFELNQGVAHWFNGLSQQRLGSLSRRAFLLNVTDFLRECVLVIDQGRRKSTRETFEVLEALYHDPTMPGHFWMSDDIQDMMTAPAEPESICNNEEGPSVSSICSAARYNDMVVLRTALLEKPELFTIDDETGRNAMNLAAEHGHHTIVRNMLARSQDGVDTPSTNTPFWTPLCWAAWNDHCDVMRELLRYDIRVNYQDAHGRTALLLATAEARTDALGVLLKVKGIGVNIPDETGRTPLHVAAQNGFHDVVVELIGHPKTAVSVRDREGHKPVDIALQNGHVDIVRVLQSKPARLKTAFRRVLRPVQ